MLYSVFFFFNSTDIILKNKLRGFNNNNIQYLLNKYWST